MFTRLGRGHWALPVNRHTWLTVYPHISTSMLDSKGVFEFMNVTGRNLLSSDSVDQGIQTWLIPGHGLEKPIPGCAQENPSQGKRNLATRSSGKALAEEQISLRG